MHYRYGFDRSSSNGIDPGMWSYIQKWASLTYNGQDASITAVRLHIQWQQYEPTLGTYYGTKLAKAVQAIIDLKPGMKVALHFPYQRGGLITDSYLADDEIARIYDGTKAQQSVSYTLPSMYSQSAKPKFYNFVDDALSHLTSNYSNILYVVMGNGDAEEFIMPTFKKDDYRYSANYENSALEAWRTQ